MHYRQIYILIAGFKSKLLGEYQGIPFYLCDNKLANDSAWAGTYSLS
ncbi:MAG: hypothetical protein CM15mV10_2540 [uncultured marine virus]|nr:MAG: hypothetical protein CM15mV10_2540 [uncultured marine virus]